MNNVKLLHVKCCFFQYFNSPEALKNIISALCCSAIGPMFFSRMYEMEKYPGLPPKDRIA